MENTNCDRMLRTERHRSDRRILFLAAGFKDWVCSTLYHEQQAIGRAMPHSVFYGPGYRYHTNRVPEILEETFGSAEPDAIFCYIDERRLLGEPLANELVRRYGLEGDLRIFPRDLRNTAVPKIAWINDFWHCSRAEWDGILLGNGFEIAFMTYCPPFVSREVFESFFSPRVRDAVRFIPWPRAVHPDTFRDYGLSKDYDVTLLGAMDPSFYPLRVRMHHIFSQQDDITYFHRDHPGYRFVSSGTALSGNAYARAINRSRIFASCTGRYRIPFIKLYEVLACRTALMCDEPMGAECLGLQEGSNYIRVAADDFLQTARHYLQAPDELARVAGNALELSSSRHTVDVRAAEFGQTLSDLLDGRDPRGWGELYPARGKRKVLRAVPEKKAPQEVAKVKRPVHIMEVARPADEKTLSIWLKYGVNSRWNETPPVVTEFPELVVLRGVYLRQLAESIQAKHLGEVGTARGYQSLMWAQYLADAGMTDGVVYTCDIDGMDRPIYQTPLTGDRLWTRRQLWAEAPESGRVRFAHGDSARLAQAIEGELDILYIDGQHTEAGVLQDFRNLSPFLRPGGIVVFDDCDERFPGVQRAVRQVCSSVGVEPQIVTFTPHKYKIAVMHVPVGYVRPARRSVATPDCRSLSERVPLLHQQNLPGLRQPEKAKAACERVPPSDRGKPRILFIVDSPNWAHDFKANNLMHALCDSYVMRKRYEKDVCPDDIAWADLIIVFYWHQFGHDNMRELMPVFERNRHKLLIGICSHRELTGPKREPGLAVLRHLAVGVFVNNLALYREIAPQLDVPVFYTPNGVNTEFFTPVEHKVVSEVLRVGWAGSLTNHGDKRGYHDFIVPAVDSVKGVELVTAARESKWRTPEEMREFYRSIDVYVCASRTEGTPNPCLEAAACGVPLVTTRVGNMPELVKQGTNGFFVQRDVGDIAGKLILLRDNPRLRKHLAESVRRSVVSWGWKHQAENYRAMFDGMLHSREGGQIRLFKSDSQLYLASADRMDRVLDNLAALRHLPHRRVDTFATVIGGLSGLNYLLSLEPEKVTFFDVNPAACTYARLIVAVALMADGPRDFISRMFGRSVEDFLKRVGHDDLTAQNQQEYLAEPIDEALCADTLSRLSPTNRETFEKYVMPHLSGAVLDGNRNCRRLLPCWPANERVPVGAGESLGRDEAGQLVPNTNTFFYGHGWLASQGDFDCVKQRLSKARLWFVPFDLLRGDLSVLGDPSGSIVLHASNIDDWFREQWAETVDRFLSQSLESQGFCVLVTTRGGVLVPGIEPHTRAYAGIRPHVFGRVVEVTHKVPWGFHEFRRTNVTYDDYLQADHPADTTILHILVGEGVPPEIFKSVYAKSRSSSARVIVLEHNRESSDWSGREVGHFTTVSELKALLRTLDKEHRAVVTCMEQLAGETDGRRNIMAVVDLAAMPSNRPRPGEIASSTRQCRELAAAGRTLIQGDSSPKVSVIVPTYNRRQSLESAIASILNQTYRDLEVVVVNDAGTDVEDLVERLNTSGNIVYLRHARNKGLAAARNTGIRAAHGKYIAYLDDDDIYYPDHIERLVASLETTDYRVAHTQACRSHQEKRDGHYVETHRTTPYATDVTHEKLLVCNLVPVLCVMHEKSCLDEVGCFDETLPTHEDWDLWIRMSRQYEFLHIPRVTAEVTWRTDGTTMTSQRVREFLTVPEIVYNKYRQFVADKPYIAALQAKRLQLLRGQSEDPQSQATDCRTAPAGEESAERTDGVQACVPSRGSVLNIAVKICTPSRDESLWGDTWFGYGLAKALWKAGHQGEVHFRDEWDKPDRDIDVAIHVKGLTQYTPKPNCLNVMWVISHPELHSPEQLNQFDVVFCASRKYCEYIAPKIRVPCFYLPQATDDEIFRPLDPGPAKDIDVLFVGNNYCRQRRRPIINDLFAAGGDYDLWVIGLGWRGYIDEKYLKADHLHPQELPTLYSRAKIVLNDHHETMRQWGFINDRTYNLAAVKAFQICTHVEGLDELGIVTYSSPEDLRRKLDYYLQHQGQRERMANVAHERCRPFTFPEAAKAILGVIHRLPGRPSIVRHTSGDRARPQPESRGLAFSGPALER